VLAGPRAPGGPARERAHLLPAPVGRARQSRAFARAVGRRWRTARASRSAPRRCRRHVSHPTRGRPLRLFRERGRPDAVAIRDTGSRCPSETGTSPGSTSDVERVPPPIGTRRPSLGRNMFRLRVDVESVSTKSGAGDFPRVPPDRGFGACFSLGSIRPRALTPRRRRASPGSPGGRQESAVAADAHRVPPEVLFGERPHLAERSPAAVEHGNTG